MKINKNIVTEKSFSFKYLYYRIARPILKINYWIYTKTHPNRPWLSQSSIEFLEERLNKEMSGLEYGSGRSTLFFAKKLNKLVSIEHHEAWYKKIKNLLAEKSISNVDYFLIPEQISDTDNSSSKNLGNRLDQLEGSESREEFFDYYNKVTNYPDEYFDFILIDGRARVKCGLNAMSKLKKGGIFVLDNSERERYKPLHEELTSWPKVETTSGLTNTTIWIKPK